MAAEALERARLIASSRLCDLVEMVTDRAIEPQATAKTVMDAAEFCYKVSGLAAKQEPKQSGTGFSIQINIPQTSGAPSQSLTFDSTAHLDAPNSDFLPPIPAYVLASDLCTYPDAHQP